MAKLVYIDPYWVNPDTVLYVRTAKSQYTGEQWTELLFAGMSHSSHCSTRLSMDEVVQLLNEGGNA